MKSKLALSIIAILCCTVTYAQRSSIDLAGEWDSSLGKCQLPGTTDENRLGDRKDEAGLTSRLTRLHPYKGEVTYERQVDIPRDYVEKLLTLYMERTKPSTLIVDGQTIGSQSLISAPHVYELPALSAGKHYIKIVINNNDSAVPRGVTGSHAWSESTQTNWNGILGKFVIEATPKTYIKDVRTYPDLENKGVRVMVKVYSDKDIKARLSFDCGRQSSEENRNGLEQDGRQSIKTALHAGENEIETFISLGESPRLWSEFHPDLYQLTVAMNSKNGTDSFETSFGMRSFATEGTQFVINGYKTFLRGTHDACVFPLTGYGPTNVEEWRRLFRIAKTYGINHYRFHSYTPPEAAFIAADEEGIYLHPELPMWGSVDPEQVSQNEFYLREAFAIIDYVGNHPSFVSFGLGNELGGSTKLMREWLDKFRANDCRHLYSMGSNNNLGWEGPQEGEDFFTTCRVGEKPNADFNEPWAQELIDTGFGTHARTSFSFADADNGGIINSLRPNTIRSFANVVPLCKTPIISHETCQFQSYPDYSEISKYTGVLYPYNFEIFRDRLAENGMAEQDKPFHMASGKWAAECYKYDMEYCLRTPGFGGYQMLDIKDYPGQGTALVGILDAFMDSKGLISPEEFSGFNSPVVPMAKMKTFCWSSDENLQIELVISNYEENDYREPLLWTISGKQINATGKINNVNIGQGEVGKAGTVELPLTEITVPQELSLTLKTGKYSNGYKLWVYPSDHGKMEESNLTVSDTLDARTIGVLENGGTVLLTPSFKDIEKQSVGGLFTPDYWSYSMFKTISENNHREVSPGTLGMIMDKNLPLFEKFPTDGYSSWQWWSIALNSRPLILNNLNKDYLPLIQTIDNVERADKLGILMEFRVGNGKLLISTTDFSAIRQYPEGIWYEKAVKSYANSADFNPTSEISVEELEKLLYSEFMQRSINGVENISNYAH